MVRILTYSVLLIVGMVLSQLPAIDHLKPQIAALTMIFLAYIMIQVGMEFEIDKNDLRKYGVDYLVAMAAAAVPWLTAAAYFWWFFHIGIAESLLVGRFAAPTSAGILFTMLAAAGLAATWTYKKARVLAIFDDLDTVLLMIPLKMMLLGFTLKLLGLGVVVIALLLAAYFMIHWLRVPKQFLGCRLCGACMGLMFRIRLCHRVTPGSVAACFRRGMPHQVGSFAWFGRV